MSLNIYAHFSIKALVIVASGFQDEEFCFPYYRMLEEGWKVDVGTDGGDDVYGKYGVPARATLSVTGYPWQVTEMVTKCEWDVLVIPGGFESPDRLRIMDGVKSLVYEMNRLGKIIGAICHGPWVCISAGIVKGRRVTGYQSIKDDLANAGGIYVDESCVRDGNLITAQHYRNNGPFMKEVVKVAHEKHWGVEVCAASAA